MAGNFLLVNVAGVGYIWGMRRSLAREVYRLMLSLPLRQQELLLMLARRLGERTRRRSRQWPGKVNNLKQLANACEDADVLKATVET